MFSIEQINLNITLEEMILDYKSELFKINKKKNLYDYRMKLYTSNINKFKKYQTDINSNNNVKIRADLYLLTCEEMIKKNKNYLNDIIEDVKEKEKFLKNEIWSLLFETMTANLIHEKTILKKDGWFVYTLPSGKIYFKKQKIIIENEERLYNFLVKNKIEKEYIDIDQNILIDLLEKDLYICEDESISNDDGLIFEGLSLSDPEIKIELNK